MDKDADSVLGEEGLLCGGGGRRGEGIWRNKKETFKILSLLERFKNI